MYLANGRRGWFVRACSLVDVHGVLSSLKCQHLLPSSEAWTLVRFAGTAL